MARLEGNNIKGFYPALDRKKLGEPFILDGKNCIVDLDGPKAAFGFQKSKDSFDPSFLVQDFTVGAEKFYFSRDTTETLVQISTLNWAQRQILPVIKLTSADLTRPKLALPWSHAYVGTYHYFANRTWGVLRYDAINNNWEDVTATIGINDIFFVTESGGRLVTLADGITSWSAIDDGMDNTPSVATGAGFQSISLVGTLEQNSDYLGLEKTSKGYISLTSKGILRSELIDSVNPFRHIPGESKHKPLNPWCVTKITDVDTTILTRFGLFRTTDGFQFEEFQPLMNEYFKLVEIPPLESLSNGFIQLYYSNAKDELYCSFSQNEVASQFNKAWVLYVKRDEWGQFNRVHKGLIEIDPTAIGTSFKQAYVDTNGKVAYLDDSTTSLAIEPQNVLAVYVQATLEYPVYYLEDVALMSTNARGGGFSLVGFPASAGYYEEFGAQETYKTENSGPTAVVVEGAVTLMPTNVASDSALIVLGKIIQEPVQYSVDSYIEVGLLRLTDEQANDQLSLFSNVAISCLDQTESTGSDFDDWLEDYAVDVFEDWLTFTPETFEDWGAFLSSGSQYTQKIRGTLDGYETFEEQFQDIDEVLIEGKTKFCSCQNAGIFQAVRLDATEVGESFHLKVLETNGILIGRL